MGRAMPADGRVAEVKLHHAALRRRMVKAVCGMFDFCFQSVGGGDAVAADSSVTSMHRIRASAVNLVFMVLPPFLIDLSLYQA